MNPTIAEINTFIALHLGWTYVEEKEVMTTEGMRLRLIGFPPSKAIKEFVPNWWGDAQFAVNDLLAELPKGALIRTGDEWLVTALGAQGGIVAERSSNIASSAICMAWLQWKQLHFRDIQGKA